MATLTAIFTAQDNLSKAMQNAGNAGSKTSGIMQKLGKIGSVAMKGIITAVTAAATALLALGKNAITAGMNFESSMSQVMATMGINKSTAEGQKAYDTLSSAAQKMGAETAYSATQAADALNYLALAGYNADQAAEALPTVLYLAGAGAMDLGRAADLVTDAMAALQMEVNQTNLNKFADQLAKTASTTNTSVAQLGDAILTVGATAANLANGTTELNTQLGILANVGIKGAEAGTHLRNILLRLQNPTEKAAKALNKLGVNVYDSNGNMRDTGAIFNDLKTAMAGMNQQEIDQIMSTIFNKTDLAAAQALLAGAGDEYARIFSIIENSGGAAAEMYMTMLDNLKGDVDMFKSATEALYLSLYTSINGTLRDLVQTGTEYMNRLNDAFKEGGFTGLANELGNVLGDAVGVVMSYAPKLVEAGTDIVIAFVESIGNNADIISRALVDIALALGNAIIKIAPKLAEAFVKIVAAAGKALTRAIPKIFNAIPDKFYDALGLDKAQVMSKVTNFANYFRDVIRKVFSGNFMGAVDSLGKALGLDEGQIESVKNVVTQLAAAFEKVKSAVIAVANAVAKFISSFASIGGIEAVLAGVAAAMLTIKAINIGKNFMAMAKGIKKAGGLMKLISANKFTLIAAAIGAVVAGIVLLVKNWEKVKETLKDGIDGVLGEGTFDKISSAISNLGKQFTKLGTWAKNAFDKMKTAFGEGYKNGGILGGIKAALASISESLGSVDWAGIGKSAWESVKSGFSATGDWIKQKVLGDSYTPDSSWGDVGAKIWEKITGGIKAAGDWIKQKVLGDSYTPDATWSDVGSKIWESIKGGIKATGDWLKEKLGYTPSDSWSSIGKDIWEKVKSGISATGDWLKTKLGYSPSDSWSSIGKSLWEKIKSGISDAGDWLKTKLGYSPSDSWSSIGKSLWEKIKSGISATGDWLKTKLGYSPSDSWSSIGKSIWEKIKSGISATGDWLKTKLGYSPSDSWTSIGKDLWDKIKSGISDTGDWLKTQLGYTPDDSWTTVGTDVWNKIKGGIESAASEGGALGAVATALDAAMTTAENVASTVSEAVTTLQSNGTAGTLWTSVQSIVQSILDIVNQCVSAFTGVGGDVAGSAAEGATNGIVAAVEAISLAVQGMATGLEWISKALGALNDAGALVPILEGLGGAIAAYFTASAVMNVVNFFKAFAAGKAIMGALSPEIAAVAAAVGALIALISWAHDRVKLEDKTVGDYMDWNLKDIEIAADATLNPNITNGEEAMQAINEQISNLVESGTIGEDVGAKLSELFSQYMTPEGMDWEAWYQTGHQAALELMNGVSEGLSSGEEPTNPMDDIVTSMNEALSSVTGQEVDCSGMFSGVEESATEAANGAVEALNSISESLTETPEVPQPDTSGLEAVGQAAEETKNAVESMSNLETPDLSANADFSGLQNSATEAAASLTDLETKISGISEAISGLDLSAAGGEAGASFVTGLQGTDPSSAASEFASAVASTIGSTVGGAFSSAGTDAANEFGTSLQTTAAGITLEAEGTTVATTFVTGMTAGMPAAVESMTTTGEQIRAAAQAVNLSAQGRHMLQTLTQGMNSGRGAAVASARATGNAIRSAFASINLYSTGVNIMQGLLNGMRSMFNTLMAEAKRMASQLKQTIQSGMQVASPSKFTTWIGEMTGQGLINGIENMTAKATAAAANMTAGVRDAMTPTSNAATPRTPTASPYDELASNGGDNNNNSPDGSSGGDRRIVIDVTGSGQIEVTGMTRESAAEMIANQIKPKLMEILSREIYTGGVGTYEF